MPDAGSTALIDGGQLGSGTVALYTSGAVDSFSLDAGYTLAAAENSAVDLTVYGNATVNGTVDLGGWPPLNPPPTWNLRFSGSNGAQSISGTGTIKLGGTLYNFSAAPLVLGPGLRWRTAIECRSAIASARSSSTA